jgi:tetratricopeptide (TPR) repeat protein
MEYLFVLLLGGGVGGFIAAFQSNKPSQEKQNYIALPLSDKRAPLGFLGDTLVGMAAATVAYALMGVLPTELPDSDVDGGNTPPVVYDYSSIIRFLGVGIAAGYAGIRILDIASQQMTKEKTEQMISEAQRQQEIKNTIDRILTDARALLVKGDYKLAQQRFEQVLRLDSSNIPAKIGTAVARNFLHWEDHKEPVMLLTQVVQEISTSGKKTEDYDEIYPYKARAYYNLACIKALNLESYSKKEVIDDLNNAINLSDSYKYKAYEDEDFIAISDDPEFKDLIKPNNYFKEKTFVEIKVPCEFEESEKERIREFLQYRGYEVKISSLDYTAGYTAGVDGLPSVKYFSQKPGRLEQASQLCKYLKHLDISTDVPVFIEEAEHSGNLERIELWCGKS